MGRLRTGVATALATLLAVACAPQAQPQEITVLAPWTGAEETAFRQVIEEFTGTRPGVRVNYQGTRALEQVLLADIEKGTPPDVTVLPSPGEVARYVNSGRVHGNVPDLPSQAGERWRQLQSLGGDSSVAAIVKTDLKSLVWRRGPHDPRPDPTWDELNAEPGGWCLGMSAPPVSGWPGTDWVEDLFLQQRGVAEYVKWVQGNLRWNSEEMKQAWRTWGTVLDDAAARGEEPASVLMTDFAGAAGEMPGRCARGHGASFGLAGFGDAPDLSVVPFPRFGPQRQPQIIAADLAVLIRPGDHGEQPKPAAEDFLRFLAQRSARTPWTPDPATSRHPITEWITGRLRSQDVFCLDASDLMPSALRNAFYRGALEFVADQSRLDSVLEQLDRVATTPDGAPLPADLICAGGTGR
jgi:alpha-glucoside transport system substrate-binding protein